MKKLFNYSLLMVLFSFIAFACSKEDGEVNPTASLRSNILPADVPIAGFNLSCLSQNGSNSSQWSFNIGEGVKHGLSNLQLELLECPDPGTTVKLGEGHVTISEAWIMIDGQKHDLTPIYNLDGSCVGTKGSDFTSFVKFEFGGNLDEDLKKYGGTLYFTLSDGDIILYGANVIIKTGGKNGKCDKGTILNCLGCNTPPPPVDNCSYSQGRFFNAGGGKGGAGWGTVTVGNKILIEGVDMLPATSPERRALFQAATLILSGTDIDLLPADVKAAFNCIVQYYTDETLNCNLQDAASKIGDWIDKNHC